MNGFIKFPIALYTLSLTLSLAQSRVLAVIVRQTIGWHKTRDGISLSQFQHGIGKEPGTGMSRTHIVAAIRWLENTGIIRVVRQVDPDGISQTSIYSLADRFLDASAPTIDIRTADLEALGSRKRGTVSQHDHGGSVETRPTKDPFISKETSSSQISDEQPFDDDDLLRTETNVAKPQPSAKPETVENGTAFESVTPEPSLPGGPQNATLPSLGRASEPPVPPSPKTAAVNLRDIQKSTLQERQEGSPVPVFGLAADVSQAKADSGLLSGLLGLGFSQRLAQQMLSSYPAGQVQAALANLPHRNARNPAGYLLAELKSGDYASPAQTPRRRAIGLLQPTATEQASEHAQAETSRLQEAIAGLAVESRAAFWQEARRNCARLGRTSVPDDSPLLQAQFELIVQQRVLDAKPEEQRCA